MSNDDRPTLVSMGQSANDEKVIMLHLDRPVTMKIMEEIHRALAVDKPVAAYQMSMNRKHQPDLIDDWSPWRNIHEENLDLYKNRAKNMPNLVKIRALIERD